MTVAFVVAVSIVLGLLLFLIREVRRPAGPKRLRIALDAIILIIALMIFWGFLIEPNRLVVRSESIPINNWSPQLDGLKIAVISDIHVGGPFIDLKKLQTIVERTNQLQPDLIVILGDYMSGEGLVKDRVEPEVFAPVLKNFNAPLGTYSVLGNHDAWYDNGKVRAGLEQNGIKVLENEVVQINARGSSFWLVGFADLWTRTQRITETMAKVPEGQAAIGLTHNPDIFPGVPERLSLLLAGHTHGGQVRFPLLGTVVVPSDYGQRYVRGHVIENNHDLFVTTGIGTSIMPVRFGVPPEIVLLTVKSK